MESNWATEHLQVIRTLMERAAIYRRALAPIMIFNGVVGSGAAAFGYLAHIDSPQKFIYYWAGIAVLAVAGSFFLVRRQALKESEPFWSPPTRRVTQALLPPLVGGLILTGFVLLHVKGGVHESAPMIGMVWLPLAWVILYGCAIHAAGFFMPRGMKIFGWALIIGGCAGFALRIPETTIQVFAHVIMGTFFGALHLAYGIYLYFTEQRKNAA